MASSPCTIGISFKENHYLHGQTFDVYKPTYLFRAIAIMHYRNEYDRIKKMVSEATEESNEARIEILDKPTGKCQAVFYTTKKVADEIEGTSKLYYKVD